MNVLNKPKIDLITMRGRMMRTTSLRYPKEPSKLREKNQEISPQALLRFQLNLGS